ncbi:AT-rich interactive domain-containing protein 1A-like isoform X2 [Penaeus japonicus]|uniref:AT-rich interactive domain-containing protein 1A-like isoform X2 n=1 Tax=Penaeus japonicus TaxID=27405 RepID=UPI001C714C9A|nr:AT-rich interactive domain-containing protein 1A-like isoform X2 [Penaeus japonicus]
MRYYPVSVVTYQENPSAPPQGEVSTNGAVSDWTYAQGGQYQQNDYLPYQYQQFDYNQQGYYDQDSYYNQQDPAYNQQQQYYGQPYSSPAYQQQYSVGEQAQPDQQEEQPQLQPSQEQQQQQPDTPQPDRQVVGECGQCWECGASFQDVALLRDHLALFHAHVQVYSCPLCPADYASESLLNEHFKSSHVVEDSAEGPNSDLSSSSSDSARAGLFQSDSDVAKAPVRQRANNNARTKQARRKPILWCVRCKINKFATKQDFETHHVGHIYERKVQVQLVRLSAAQLKRVKVDSVRGRRSSSGFKLKLRISKVGRGRGRKRREVRIVSNEEGMSESHNSLEDQEGTEAESLEQEETEAGEEGGIPERTGSGEGESEGEEEDGLASEEAENQEEGDHSPGYDEANRDEHQDYEPEEQDSREGHSGQQQQQDEEEEEAAASSHQKEAQADYQQEKQGGEQGAVGTAESSEGFSSDFSEQELAFGTAGPSEAPPSTYQPQFESFPTSDWFSEYESGPRIAAAMAGATTAESASESSAWASGTEGAANPTYTTASTPPEKGGSSPPVNGGTNEGDGEDGLFSQAVLGQESPEKNDRQGSFEQLCLNDSFSNQNEQAGQDQSDQQQDSQIPSSEQQQQQQQASGVTNDLLSELEYLNNSGQGSQGGQVDGSPHSGGPSPHSGGPATPSHLSSRGSNSGTPTSSSGHPTPPPSDTSFRALATSPLTSPPQGSSPAVRGPTPPATSPLQQQLQQSPQGGDQQQQGGVPRLTIANNLMAPTTSTAMLSTTTNSQVGVGGMMSQYGNQWPQASGYTGRGGYASLAGTSMANTNLGAPLRAPLPPSVAMPYRPSPPPRVRGRPPLMGQMGRPPLHQGPLLQPSRGPGRPPTSSILPPPLMPAPGGRGGMMPPLQRMHQTMYPGQRQPSPQQQGAAGKRQMLGAAGHSPNKSARREDINVPSRQKDNECQIIAVANRTDGLPVIANVQGGSAAPGSQQRGSSSTSSGSSNSSNPPSTESTINLSDSITLSVRTSSANKEPVQRGERGGPDAGAVANLLASRGITVTPAAGERQEGGAGGRDDRRLPTAQELNLSSAISVHPPTQREREAGARERDRDGFAVPQAPASRGSGSGSGSGVTNSNVERPPRPPTVDLTQDVPTAGSQGTRHQCHQCDRSFPTASLLAEHSRVHQQHQQSRMPFKCHLCTAGFSTQKGQQHHYQQFHQLHLSAGDVAIPLVDLRNPVNVQRMAALGIRSFLPLTNLQNRGAGGVVGVPILTLENLRNGHMTLQQWGVSDVLSLGPAKTLNMPR